MNFRRWIGIDWSGAACDTDRVKLAICVDEGGGPVVHTPPGRARRWSRAEAVKFLATQLTPDAPPTLVGIDAAFGYPAGTTRALFDEESWPVLVREMAAAHRREGRARAVGHALNASFPAGRGPFRFNEGRNDAGFYVDHGVAYFRQTDLLTPQCISPFYLGSGAAVGFHTITLMAAFDHLLDARERGEADFVVWPQEGLEAAGARHVIAECYPSAYPVVADHTQTNLNDDEADAWRAVAWLRAQHPDAASLVVPRLPVGRHLGFEWEEQLRVEGWILMPAHPGAEQTQT